jgi:hypothetical protein
MNRSFAACLLAATSFAMQLNLEEVSFEKAADESKKWGICCMNCDKI